MLHNVPIKAAPTERNWLIRGEIHIKLRNSMKVHTVSQVTFIKQNLMLEYTALFKKMPLEQQSEQIKEDREPEFEESIFDEECDIFVCDSD